MENNRKLRFKFERKCANKDEELIELHEELKAFKHDYGNFIQAIDGYTKMNNMDGIKKLCENARNEYFNSKF